MFLDPPSKRIRIANNKPIGWRRLMKVLAVPESVFIEAHGYIKIARARPVPDLLILRPYRSLGVERPEHELSGRIIDREADSD